MSNKSNTKSTLSVSILGALSPEELLDIATRMAQELQDICDDAIQAGSQLPSTQGLVNEWETEYFAKTNLSWKNVLHDKANTGLACLDEKADGALRRST